MKICKKLKLKLFVKIKMGVNNLYIFAFIGTIIILYTAIPIVKIIWKWKCEFNTYRKRWRVEGGDMKKRKTEKQKKTTTH